MGLEQAALLGYSIAFGSSMSQGFFQFGQPIAELVRDTLRRG
jgi:hypothetical protein